MNGSSPIGILTVDSHTMVREGIGAGSLQAAAIGTSAHHSLQVLTGPAGKGYNAMVAYTLAKAQGDTDGGNFGSAISGRPMGRWSPNRARMPAAQPGGAY